VDNAAAFGDNTNDLSMVQAAGRGVAMKNSDDVLLTAAKYITTFDNNNAGVGKTIMEFLNS
jgi:hypothetical protein